MTKVTKIAITNLFGVSHLELDGRPVEMRGAKGTGKTSVIDAIKYALTNKSERPLIIKQGESEGEVFFQTDTGISATRKKHTEKSDMLKVSDCGKVIGAPQGFLNGMFTALQLNPVEFAGWTPEQQNRAILDLVKYDWGLDDIKAWFGELPQGIDFSQHILQVLEDIQSKKSPYWLAREEYNRQELHMRQSAKMIADSMPPNYSAEQWENYSIAEKAKELQILQESNSRVERAKLYLDGYNDKIRGLEASRDISISAETKNIDAERAGLDTTIARLKAEIATHEASLLTLGERLEGKIALCQAAFEKGVAQLDGDSTIAREWAGKEVVPVEALQKELDHAEEMKKYVSEYRLMLKMQADCADLLEKSKAMTEKIQKARTLPAEILATCELPITGLTIKDGIPLIKGLPISNLSNGEKIELCIDVAVANPSGLEIILIDGVEQLDDQSREALYEKCKARGLQIIAARTTNDNEFTIVEL